MPLSFIVQQQGFTLLELMVSLAVFAITLGLAIPSFQSLITSNRLTTQTNALLNAIYYTRSEAIKRNAHVVLCSSQSANQCDGGSWADGWLIFSDANKNAKLDAGEIHIHSGAQSPKGLVVRGNQPVSNSIRFSPEGFLFGLPGSIFVCAPTKVVSENQRTIIINRVGRVRTERVNNNGLCP